MYTAPLSDIIRQHDMNFHLYADDTQVYISFESSSTELARASIEACVSDIDKWMSQNLLKMNRSKTELLILNAKHRPSPPIDSVTICDAAIQPSRTVRNIGAIFDSSLSMEIHIKESCKSALFHLRNIARIRKHLSLRSAETLIHSFVTCRLDFCNSLLYGVPNQLTQKLQSVQNSAARLVCLTKKQEHITPVLIQLHWLPIEYRIQYKIVLLTFKCLNDNAPGYLKDLIHQYVPKRRLRSCSKNYLAKELYNLKGYGFKAFSVAAPTLWNALPDDLRDHTLAESAFKKKLKTFLFKKAFF